MSRIEIFFLYLLSVLISLIAPILLGLPPLFISLYVCPQEPTWGAFTYGVLFRLPLFLANLTLFPCWFSYGKGNRRSKKAELTAASCALLLGLYFVFVLIRGTANV